MSQFQVLLAVFLLHKHTNKHQLEFFLISFNSAQVNGNIFPFLQKKRKNLWRFDFNHYIILYIHTVDPQYLNILNHTIVSTLH